MCDVLEEMRVCHKTHNYAALPALIEEVQVMGNRMESALGTKRDLAEMQEEWHTLKKEIKKMRKEKKKKSKPA